MKTICEHHEWETGRWGVIIGVSRCKECGVVSRTEHFPKLSSGECQQCIEIGTGMGPSHDGSKQCESGSIASGGKYAHCSCDVCF